MKSSKFYPPSPQAPKISDKASAEYAAMSDAEREALSERPEFKRYYSRYNEMDCQHAEQEAEQRAHDAQRLKDKKQACIHDFVVAAFGSAFALLLEHMGDIVDFVKRLFEFLWAH